MLMDRVATPQALTGLDKATPVLLAFSGGADSRALLHFLSARAKEDGFALTLAHVNHGIRGEEALRDRRFCQAVAEDCGLELCILDADVPALAKAHGRGLEEEARSVRYEYFERLMRDRNIPLLATAHHADDNLETVLFHLCRGTGLAGLCGIAPTRPLDHGILTRPLLQVSRREILAYCRENGLEYVTDSTNEDISYARNRIRGEVIPILSAFFEELPARTYRMTEALREDEKLLSTRAAELVSRAETDGGLLIAPLRDAPTPIRSRALMQWVKRETGCAPERVHLDGLQMLIDRESTAAQVALHADFCAVAELGVLRIREGQAEEAEPFRLPFSEGQTLICNGQLLIDVEKRGKNTKINNLSTESYINLRIDFDIIKDGLFWRSYRAGDLLLRGGMHKKLRKLYGEAGVPVHWRTRLPLLCDGEGIVWAPFVGARDGILFGEATHRIGVQITSRNKKGRF